MEEPSLLDLLKRKLNPKRWFTKHPEGVAIEISEFGIIDDIPLEMAESKSPFFIVNIIRWIGKTPWRSLTAMALALIAQSSLEPPLQNSKLGIVFYAAAAAMMIFALMTKEWKIVKAADPIERGFGLGIRTVPMFLFIILIFATFLLFRENRFTLPNLMLWLATLIEGLAAFWESDQKVNWAAGKNRFISLFHGEHLSIKVDFWKILVVAVFLLSTWFHLYQLNNIPINMTSDHTEKLLDIKNVLDGQYQIFFSNNGGREPIQFYLAAFFVKALNTGLSFFTLKLTMTVAFLMSLIYVYRLGKELGNPWTGLFFMALVGFSSWANIITRVGLRLILAPAILAPTLFYLFRGLRLSRRNDFIVAGLLIGLGLLGYSAFRIVPIVVVLIVFIFIAHHRFNKVSRNTWWTLGLLAVFALVVFLPLLRFAVEYPEAFGFRTITRITSVERQFTGGVLQVFFNNLWNCLTMPFWKDGNTWVISVPDRPALDVVSAALYFLGLILLVIRWLQTRRWQDMALLFSIPVLMLPSILALAFPEENPSLSRAGGAMIPIFLICAIALESLLKNLWSKSRGAAGKVGVVILGSLLVGFSAMQNFDIALLQYPVQYKGNTWNSSQMGEVAKEFIQLTGNADNIWVVGVPYWVDTRLVALSAGYVGEDYAIWPEEIISTQNNPGAKLFLVKWDDREGMNKLISIYPEGFITYHAGDADGKDFYAYIVPPEK